MAERYRTNTETASQVPPGASHGAGTASVTDRIALRVLQLGTLLVVLLAAPYKQFDLDRFFVPKELALHVTALGLGEADLVLAVQRRELLIEGSNDAHGSVVLAVDIRDFLAYVVNLRLKSTHLLLQVFAFATNALSV